MALPKFAFRVHGRIDKKTVFRYQTNMQRQDCYPYTVSPDQRTPAQLACRAKFAAGMAAWKEKSPEIKADWESKSRWRGMAGVNLFMRWFMRHGDVANYAVSEDGSYFIDEQGRKFTL